MEAPFAGRAFELVNGEVYGLRSWLLSGGGILQPRYWGQYRWTPGINEARCLAVPPSAVSRPDLVIDPRGQGRVATHVMQVARRHPGARHGWDWRVTWQDGTRETWEDVQLRELHPDHGPVPDEECTCGFYAYSDEAHMDRPGGSNVIGIIRGTGRTLIGSRGFRCQRAEIVALVDPGRRQRGVRWGNQAQQLRHRYPKVPVVSHEEALFEGFAMLARGSRLDGAA